MDTAKLSTEAKKALVSARPREGAVIDPFTKAKARQELVDLGYIGAGNGLTRKGVIMRERVMTEALDAFFN